MTRERGKPRDMITREEIEDAHIVTSEDHYCDGFVYAVLVKDLDGKWWSRLLPDASWSGAALELANIRTNKSKCLDIRVIRVPESVSPPDPS